MVAEITHYWPHAVGAAVTGSLAWFGRFIISQIKAEWQSMKDKLDAAIGGVNSLATNHITHVNDSLKELCTKQDEANKKSDQQLEALQDIVKGIAVLVDRGGKRRR